MKVYEFPAKISREGNLEIPDALLKSLAEEEMVRVIILVGEAPGVEEDSEWSRFAAGQLLRQYNDADAIYDNI
jgi:hypothetical protein